MNELLIKEVVKTESSANSEVQAEEKSISFSESRQIAEYIAKVSRFPVLTEEEEKSLIKDFFENKNMKAGHAVVNSHLRLVVKIAMGYKRYHSSLMDLIAEGNLGLLKALKNFSIEKHVRFATYAILWIKASIKEFLTKSISSVKAITTNSQKKLLFGLSGAKKYLGIEGKVLDVEGRKKVSKILNVSEEEISKHETMMFETKEVYLSDSKFDEDEGERGDFISSNSLTPEVLAQENDSQNLLKQKIANAMKGLSKREAEILKYRILNSEKYTLEDLSNKFKVSKERIRQIQENALKKMKSLLA